jgi:hypothetical protein
MKPHRTPSDRIRTLDAESSAVGWIAVTIALFMTVISLLAAALA